MRITGLAIKAFGKLKDRTFTDIDKNIVLVQGRNESGKTTLFHLIRTLLFGFNPAQAALHPYAPWSGETLECAGRVVLENGEELEISRKLAAAPQGKIIMGNLSENIKNRPIPHASHVTGEVYHQVYSLRLEELAMLKEGVWGEVQDMLLMNLGRKAYKMPREMLTELEQEAASLWRDDRRGKPRYRELQDQLNLMAAQRRDALIRNEELHRIAGEQDLITRELKKLETRRLDLRIRLKKIEKLLPARENLQKIENLQKQLTVLPDPALFQDCPERELEVIQGVMKENAEAIEEMEIAVKELKADRSPLSEKEMRLVQNKESIYALYQKQGLLASSTDAMQAAERRLAGIETRIRAKLKDLFDSDWDMGIIERVKNIRVSDLRVKVSELAGFKERHDALQRNLESMEILEQAGKPKSFPVGSMLLFGACMAGVSVWIGSMGGSKTALSAGGIALPAGMVSGMGGSMLLVLLSIMAAISGFLIWRWVSGRFFDSSLAGTKKEEYVVLRNNLRRSEQEMERCRKELGDIVKGLPLSEYRLVSCDPSLPYDMNVLRDDTADWFLQKAELSRLEEKRREVLQTLEDMERTLEFYAAGEPAERMQKIADELELAQERYRRHENTAHGLEGREKELERLKNKQQKLQERAVELKERLAAAGQGDWQEGIRRLERSRELAKQLKELESRLGGQYPELDTIRAEIAAYEREDLQAFDDGKTEQYKDEIESIQDRISGLEKQLVALRSSSDHLLEKPALDDIDGEMESLREEMKSILKKRDCLMLLYGIIKKADIIFREEHQPDVLRRAGEYLGRITGGKYNRLFFEESGESTALMIRAAGDSMPVAVSSPLSRGTMEQVYLSLRMSLVDHLDGSNEKLPVCLDETFVNWDRHRTRGGLQVLKSLAEQRQVFIFTCRDEFAQWIREELDVGVMDLDE